jgi:hypothetical protein
VLVTAVVVPEAAETDADRFEADEEAGDAALCATAPVWAVGAVPDARSIARPIATKANTLNVAVILRAREAACRARRFREAVTAGLRWFRSPSSR